MKKINTIWGAVVALLLLGMVVQGCASSKNRYGCPERIEVAGVLP
ncbi:MAG: hypothetical protein QM642_08970 [Edaphocola sp.]